MQTIFDAYDRLRVQSAAHYDALALAHKLTPGQAPIGGFNVVNELAVIGMEALSHYHGAWSALPTPTSAQQRERVSRVMTLGRATFVLGMSSLEQHMKAAVQQRPGKVALPTGRIYLGALVKTSGKAGVIGQTDIDGWNGLIEVRNTVVHNNGVAELTQTYALHGGLTVSLTSGQMIQGSLTIYPDLLSWAVDAFRRWCDGFL